MAGGRRPDKFAWKHAIKRGKVWECKYCGEEYAGSASRVKNHLAGIGGGIRRCDKVRMDVKLEAEKFVLRKEKGQISSSPKNKMQAEKKKGSEKGKFEDCDGVDVANPSEEETVRTATTTPVVASTAAAAALEVSPSPLLSSDNCPFDHEEWENQSDWMAWFQLTVDDMICANLDNRSAEQEVSNNTNDVAPTTISNSWRAIPSSSTTSTINHGGLDFPNNSQYVTLPSRDATELEANIASTCTGMASASSEKCGQSPHCTVILYSLNDQSKHTLGFYSPNGFFFAKAPDVLLVEKIRALSNKSSSSSYNGTVMHFMGHVNSDCIPIDQVCKFSDHDSNGKWINNPGFCSKKCSCLGHEIISRCTDICKKSPDWAWKLIERAEEIHQLIYKLRSSIWFYETERGRVKELACGERENHLSRFLSIILLEVDVKHVLRLSKSSEISSSTLTQVQKILDNSEFWEQGRELQRALSPVLLIPNLIDTLVPAAGYLEIYMKRANHIIFSRGDADKRPKKDPRFWTNLHMYLVGNDNIALRRPIATYLNPGNLWSEDVQEMEKLKGTVKSLLPNLVGTTELDNVMKELEQYSDKSSGPFNPEFLQLRSHHPLKLWQKHGHALPLLQKYAIQELSQPVSCMSNQVKKHLHECDAAGGDFLENLNRRMRDEFRSMGDKIYKPVDLSLFDS